jgi:glucose/mannose transport system substrate-binding protein
MQNMSFAATAALFAGSLSVPASAQNVEVIHWLTAGAESAAIQTLADAVEAQGVTWTDRATPGGGSDARALFSSMIAGGTPPGAMFLSIGPDARSLGAQGVLRDLSPGMAESGLADAIPGFALDLARGDGDALYALPIAFETQNFLWYSIPAYAAAGIAPPATWQGFIEQGPALREAGIIPLAVGAQGWQLNLLFTAVLSSVAGPDVYLAALRDHDAAAAGGDAVVEAMRVMRALSELTDAGSPNRAWNDTLNLVAQGQAAAQVMGSWAGAELLAMESVYGSDWGCSLAGGDIAVVGATGFMFPAGADEAGQDVFIKAMLDPVVQSDFSVQKGSIPAHSGADVSGLSACSQIAANAVQSGKGLPNMSANLSSDGNGELGDLMSNFWADRSITPEAAAATFAEIIAAEK